MVIVYALLSALSYGSADFLGGFSSRKNPAITVVAWSQLAGLAAAMIAAPLLGADSVSLHDILWGMAAGLAGAAGVGFLFYGLATGLASVVSPTAALSGAVLPVLFGLLMKERPSALAWVGVALALPAILLLSTEKKERKGHALKSLQLGLLAGLAFGGFFILISRTSDGSGLWPLVAARGTTVPLFFLLILIRKDRPAPVQGTMGLTLLSGVLDMLANIFFLLASRTGFLIIAVILTTLYPAPTVLFQRLFLKEEITPLRIIGLVMSIAGAVLIGIG